MCQTLDENDYRPGDSEVPILRKILNRLGQLVGFGPPSGGGGEISIGPVTLTASDIEIGAVEIKDGSTDTRAKIRTDDPQPSDEGLVVRNIPSGTQDVEVTNFPATQNVVVMNFPATQPVSAVALPLPAGAATEATLAARLSESAFQARINTLGQKTSAASTPVVLASDQSVLQITSTGGFYPAQQSGVWTVQPGNTPNTTPWFVANDWRLNAVPKRYSVTSILSGAAVANTNLMGVRKLGANPDVYIIRIRLHIFHVNKGRATVLAWRRATTVAGGALVAVADIPKLDTAAANATLEVRTGAVTGTKAAQYIITHPAHTTFEPAANTGSPWIDEWISPDKGGRIRLTGDEGLVLDQQTAGDVENRYHILIEWEEA
jgi:hypothetical protein